MDGVVTALEFIQTGNYFYFNYYFIFSNYRIRLT